MLGLEDGARGAGRKNSSYVQPCVPGSFDPRRASEFSFKARPGELVVVFTDGIDECHYRNPATSVRPAHIQALWMRSYGESETFCRELTQLALTGVEGNPGGEDNIALGVTRA